MTSLQPEVHRKYLQTWFSPDPYWEMQVLKVQLPCSSKLVSRYSRANHKLKPGAKKCSCVGCDYMNIWSAIKRQGLLHTSRFFFSAASSSLPLSSCSACPSLYQCCCSSDCFDPVQLTEPEENSRLPLGRRDRGESSFSARSEICPGSQHHLLSMQNTCNISLWPKIGEQKNLVVWSRSFPSWQWWDIISLFFFCCNFVFWCCGLIPLKVYFASGTSLNDTAEPKQKEKSGIVIYRT